MIATVSRRDLMAMLCAGATLGVTGFTRKRPCLRQRFAEGWRRCVPPDAEPAGGARPRRPAGPHGHVRGAHENRQQWATPTGAGRALGACGQRSPLALSPPPGVRFRDGPSARDVKTFEALLENPAAPSFAAPA